jgi:hypothetical protein
MRVSGFTFVRDGARLGYPFEESIRSLLPLVDELVVAVGESDDPADDTRARVDALAAADARVAPFATRWPAPQGGGDVLAQQTNLALERCTGDWAIYLQADEVLHEADYDRLRAALHRHLDRGTEGLVFDYLHFWKAYDLVADDWASFYPRAVRAVKTGIGVMSAGDAAGFLRRRHGRTRGLIKATAGARVFHYGWCNPPARQAARMDNLQRLYASPAPDATPIDRVFGGTMPLRRFRGAHPSVMSARATGGTAAGAAIAQSRWPAGVRAAAQVLRHPYAAREWARPFFPVGLTNVYWRAVDRARERRA